MRILVTGGFGYVGGRLGRHLMTLGHQVILGSRVAGAPPDWLPGARTAVTRWDDADALAEICRDVELVVHAAGMNAADSAADPAAALAFNAVATSRLVEAGKKVGVRQFVYLSTAHVYARPLLGEIAEDTCPRNLHPYASSHLAGENALLFASESGALDGVVVRLSNAIGAPVAVGVNCWMLLFCDLCREAITSRSLTLRTNSNQQRDFVTLTDVCRAIEHLTGPSPAVRTHRIYNVGAGRSMSLLALAEMIQERCRATLGFSPQLRQLQAPTSPIADAERLLFRMDRLKSEGYQSTGNFAGETDAMLSFCREAFLPAR